MEISNDQVITVALFALAVYFSVLVVRVAWQILQFRRVRRNALLTWPVPRPQSLAFAVTLGLVSAGLAVVLAQLQRPLHHVYSQGVMAIYFLLVVPLGRRIQLGLYRDGVWADGGFLPWTKVSRLAFRESPDIVLVLLRRGGGAFRLPVPPAEYGAVRKVLEEKMRAHVINMDTPILGLGGPGR